LSHQHHPYKSTGDEAKFKEANEAYQVLSDSKKRAQYDQFGQTFSGQGGSAGGSAQGGGFDFSGFGGGGANGFHFDFGSGGGFEDIFSDMFSGGGFGGGQSRRRRARGGADVRVDVEITFEEMAAGVEKEIRVRKYNQCTTCKGTGGKPGSRENTCATCKGHGQVQQTYRTILGSFAQASECPECHGRGKIYAEKCPECRGDGRVLSEATLRVPIPAGVDNGVTLSVEGAGEMGEAGAPAGDLLITVHVKEHAIFEREGKDILIKKTISFAQAALGDSIRVETLEGSMKMKVPAGTQSGEMFRLAGKGIQSGSRWSSRGDAFVKITVTVPKKLSREQKKLIEALKEIED
jgi:molecular chaperone DnaJ